MSASSPVSTVHSPVPHIVGFSGSAHRPSRTRALVESVIQHVSGDRPVDATVFDLVDVGTNIGFSRRQDLPQELQDILNAIEKADALVVGSPVYKGSYTGLFKHVIDFIDPAALAGKPVVLAATGGGHGHALVVEHQLRPLFGFFSALTIPTALYAADSEFADGVPADEKLRARIIRAAHELERALDLASGQSSAASVHHPRTTRVA